MSIIDLSILTIIVISILVGMYYGFSVSLLNIASFIISWISSLLFHSSFTRMITKRYPDLIGKIVYYSEGSSKTPFSDKVLPVSSLTVEKITNVVAKAELPNPFSRSIETNLTHQSLEGLSNLGQYFDYTVANIILNLASFMIIFIVLQLIFIMIISLTKNVTNLPVLKKFDSLSAGVLGLFRGVLFLFIVFAFVPLLYLVVPADFLGQFLGSSKLVRFFIDANFFTAFIRGVF